MQNRYRKDYLPQTLRAYWFPWQSSYSLPLMIEQGPKSLKIFQRAPIPIALRNGANKVLIFSYFYFRRSLNKFHFFNHSVFLSKRKISASNKRIANPKNHWNCDWYSANCLDSNWVLSRFCKKSATFSVTSAVTFPLTYSPLVAEAISIRVLSSILVITVSPARSFL